MIYLSKLSHSTDKGLLIETWPLKKVVKSIHLVIKVGARSNFGGTVPIMRYDKHSKGFLTSIMRLTLHSKQFAFDVFNHFSILGWLGL